MKTWEQLKKEAQEEIEIKDKIKDIEEQMFDLSIPDQIDFLEKKILEAKKNQDMELYYKLENQMIDLAMEYYIP